MKQDYINRIKKFRFKHSLGQNFLVDEDVINKIAGFVDKDDYIFEIGAGAGFVTEKILEKANFVRAVEIDKNVIKILQKNCEKCGSECDFKIIEGDILKTDISSYQKDGKKFKVIANIPYYITSPILTHILGEIDDIGNKNRKSISEIILMVQFEVGQRLVATNLSKRVKDYGLLSILAQFWADVELIGKVSRYSFYPTPSVDSALVRLKINEMPRVPVSKNLREVLRGSFGTRRKNIKNCLKNAGFKNVDGVLEKCGIKAELRAENLSLKDFSNIAEEFLKYED